MSIQGQRAASEAQAKALDYQNQMQRQQAEWNRDQLQKQANYDESVAQKNMRRERENNKRELARRRASSARGGLMETGAVSDNLIEASERHQSEIDDLWERASTEAQRRREQASMAMWEADVRTGQLGFQKTAMKRASKASQWGTAISGIGSIAGSLAKMGGKPSNDVWSQKATPSTRNYKSIYG